MQHTRKRKLGKTNREISPIGLGAMPLSIQGRPDERQAIEVIHAALDAGVEFIDTADVYCLDDSDIGHNERLIRKALNLRNAWDSVVFATKGGLIRPQGDWVCDARPKVLRKLGFYPKESERFLFQGRAVPQVFAIARRLQVSFYLSKILKKWIA